MQVKELMSKNVDMFFEDSEGHTALHLAAKEGHAGVLEMLIAAGGLDIVQKKSRLGKTALDLAVEYNQREAIDMIKKMADELEIKEIHSTAESMLTSYRGGLLSEEDYKVLVLHTLLKLRTIEQKRPLIGRDEKFVGKPMDFVCGQFAQAAGGVIKLLNVDEIQLKRSELMGVKAIEDEVKALGDKDVEKVVACQLDYILHQEATTQKFENGVRDQGHEGMRLDDFVNHPNSKIAGLTVAEVVALRLYTTPAFKIINTPLRESKEEPHPLPVTVVLITSGIKKLRQVKADKASAKSTMILWRGLKNIKPTDKFAEEGGTEVCALLPQFLLFHANIAFPHAQIMSI
jgi:hypothetical protein